MVMENRLKHLLRTFFFVVAALCYSAPLFAGDPASTANAPGQLIVNTDGTTTDSKSGLMWASADNGKNINWQKAKAYCDEFSSGGHKDWRLPTVSELAGLYEAGVGRGNGAVKLSGIFVWAAESRGAKAAFFRFKGGRQAWENKDSSRPVRVLPVRNIQ